jgi:hypothetical protein
MSRPSAVIAVPAAAGAFAAGREDERHQPLGRRVRRRDGGRE